MEQERDIPSTGQIPRIVVPKPHPPSQKEIERRRAIYDHMMELREHMKPMDISASEIIRLVARRPRGVVEVPEYVLDASVAS
ncbi:MAG: hypothetical protein HYX94_08145 [Chloroflexi bacterium]|nr:hypothetical protein [Chloroflexota bacterium]